ncbi:hypothetical protein NM688_g8905 [Phlebia brevispora]|uniref:Uncharacterized protein n=1 Tax=Phlebia brevispora TaxID=194682 RepID=A0ACC1RNP4_9APHY|nr:hypothetical protein NM688_g8905 [Phlebia brevispora]
MRGGTSNAHYLSTSPSIVVPEQQENSWNFPSYEEQPDDKSTIPNPPAQLPLSIKIPPMAPSTRRSARQHADSNASGSEYHMSNASMDVDDQDVPDDEEEDVKPQPPPPEYTKTSRGRRITKKNYQESDDSGDELNLLIRSQRRRTSTYPTA